MASGGVNRGSATTMVVPLEGKTRALLGSVAMALARGAGISVLLVDDVTVKNSIDSRTLRAV